MISFEDIAIMQNWNADSQLHVLREYIKSLDLEDDLIAYAQAVADFERGG